jgi:hypothetical protein
MAAVWNVKKTAPDFKQRCTIFSNANRPMDLARNLFAFVHSLLVSVKWLKEDAHLGWPAQRIVQSSLKYTRRQKEHARMCPYGNIMQPI